MNLFSRLFRKDSKVSRKPRCRPTGRRLRIESLEQRAMFSSTPINVPIVLSRTFTVTNIADSGVGSLRWAIGQVNQDSSVFRDTINFQIPKLLGLPLPTFIPTITPKTALPAITRPVKIDGTTQLLFHQVEINGASALNYVIGPFGRPVATTTPVNGLDIRGGTSLVQGLVIDGFSGNGIALSVNGNDLVQDNYIGTNKAGTDAAANKLDGVLINNVANNIVGFSVGSTSGPTRNVISGNGRNGVEITGSGATGNMVRGNYIGTDASGEKPLANGSAGVLTYANTANNTIGGTDADDGAIDNNVQARNIISGNGTGVSLAGANNLVEGNYIGTDSKGLNKLSNSTGVLVVGGNTVGGTAAGAGNVISGNTGDGLRTIGLNGGPVAGTALVQGNFIGTDSTGEIPLPNGGSGVHILANFDVFGHPSFTNAIIGGWTQTARNVISGNLDGGTPSSGAGVFIDGGFGDTLMANQVLGNDIGVDLAEAKPLPNQGFGVAIKNASGNTIGGTTPGSHNVISGNNGYGVYVFHTGTTAVGNKVIGNFIGTDRNGTKNLGNTGSGVEIISFNNQIGGTAAGDGNTIAFNFDGVEIASGNGNAIVGNSIFGNVNLGIELQPGTNNQQPAPKVTAASAAANSVTVKFTLTGKKGMTYTIEFFANLAGESQGRLGLGRRTLAPFAADATLTFQFTLANVAVLPGKIITATATDQNGNTSQFSNGQSVT